MVGPQITRNGVVAIDPHTTRSGVAWDHSPAGTNDDMSRFGMIATIVNRPWPTVKWRATLCVGCKRSGSTKRNGPCRQ